MVALHCFCIISQSIITPSIKSDSDKSIRVGGDLDAVAMLYDVYYWFCSVTTGRRVMVDWNKLSRRPIFWQTEPASGHKGCILPLKYITFIEKQYTQLIYLKVKK